MTEFEKAVEMSFEKYVASLPSVVPPHNFSQKHIDAMNELFYPKPELKRKKVSKKTVRFIIIAAVLLSLAVTAVANPVSREYIVEKFSNHSEYQVNNTKKSKKMTPLKLNYIPVEFEKNESSAESEFCSERYRNIYSAEYFYIQKISINAYVGFDTERYNSEKIEIKGKEALFYRSSEETIGIIFNDGDYIYLLGGNISQKELVKIAQNVE